MAGSTRKSAPNSIRIRKFLEQKGWTRSQIMVFGDGENDIEMLKFAGIGVLTEHRGKQALVLGAMIVFYVALGITDG